MSMDRTLRGRSGLAGNRSVMKRAERIAKMAEEGKFEMEGSSPMGLPKYKVRHSRAGMKAKKTEEKAAEGATPAAAAPAAAAPAAKGAAKGKAKD